MRHFSGLLLLLLTACHSESLVGVTSSLRFELVDPQTVLRNGSKTPSLVFPSVYAGASARASPVNVINEGRVPLEVSWSSLKDPFSASLPTRLEPGSTVLSIGCGILSPGPHRDQLKVTAVTGATASLDISAGAWSQSVCKGSSCTTATFDADRGSCVETPLPDGQACDAETLCIDSPTCQSGRCVGTTRECDDGNACTVDVCHPQTGCEHLPPPPCPGDSICQVGVCHPKTGCGLAPAPDGTRCGPQQTCTQAQICIGGSCVVRDPPEGYVCEEASPCSDEGHCVGTVCTHQQPPTTLISWWNFDSVDTAEPDAGVSPWQVHDFVMEPSGAITVSGFFNTPPILRANESPTTAPLGTARRCIIWNTRLVCADYPPSPSGQVTALDPSTGETLWTFSIRKSRPAYTEVTDPIFLARLVALGSDRLAAVYEAYPVPAPSTNQLCRTYFLIVMNASGQLVTAQPISDPLLDVCDHPHPYGATADSVGNLYIAFSPTANDGTPLLPDRPTLLVSYTREGVFRWKVLDPLIQGGELAVARGLLYFENSPVVLDAPTGHRAFSLEYPLGRAVVADARMIPAPIDGASTLYGFEAGLAQLRWSHRLPEHFFFWGEQLRLARWSTSFGPKTVALTFITDATTRRLHAVDVQNGFTAFSCDIAMPWSRTVPQLFEVADEHLAVMHGALDSIGNPSCGKCDPPFAGSSAAFQTFEMKGLFTSPDPWPGTFGGPSHDHHEKTLQSSSP